MIEFSPTNTFEHENKAGVTSVYLKGETYRINDSNKEMVTQVKAWHKSGKVVSGFRPGEVRPRRLTSVK